MTGSIFKRQEALAEALKQRQQIRAAKHKDASAKQRAAVPSTKSKLKKKIAQLKKAGRAREL
jgi:hypothetical protein